MRTLALSVVVSACLLTAPGVDAQTKPKPKPKPAPPKQTSTAPTKGTVQLAGDNGKIGTTYQLGPKDQELHFTLESASVAPFFKTPDDNIIAGENQRILVLTFNVHNPQKRDMQMNWASFRFTAFAPDDQAFKDGGYWYAPDSGKRFDTYLKPAQKARATVAIPIFAQGPLRKLMVQRETGPVLRYDLADKLGKMTSSFSPNGLDMVQEITAELGKPFDAQGFEVEVQEIKVHETDLGDSFKRYQNQVFTSVTAKFTNLTARPQLVTWSTLRPVLSDEDGQPISFQSTFVGVNSLRPLTLEVAPGDSVRGMWMFKGDIKIAPHRLRLSDDRSKRVITIPLAK